MIRAMPRSRPTKRPLVALARFARQAVALTVLAACLLLAAAFGAIAVQGNAVARDATGIRAEIARLEAEVAQKQAAVAERETDAYLVERARDLGFVRAGEAMILVQREARAAIDAATEGRPGRLAKWWALFFR